MPNAQELISIYTSQAQLSNLLESDKFGLVMVESYDVNGDGVTDDTTEVQKAIDFAISQGTNVVALKGGTSYAVSGLTDTSSVVFIGQNSSFVGDSITVINWDKIITEAVLGVLTDLTTTEKGTIVGAINELDADIGNLASLTTSVKTSVVNSINSIISERGALGSLTTSVATSIVNAINSIITERGALASLSTSNKTSIVNAINSVITERGALTSLTTTVKTSIVNAINELDGDIGDLSSLTTSVKTSIVNAINELVTSIGAVPLTTSFQLESDGIEGYNQYLVTDDSNKIVRVEHIDDATSVDRVNAIQLVDDGDFADTTEWTPAGATLTASDNVLYVEGTGAIDSPYFIASPTNRQDVTSVDKIYVFARGRVTNSLADDITLTFVAGGANNVEVINTPLQNQWYELSGIVTPSSTTTGYLQMSHSYGSTGDATNAVMEVDGRAGFGVKIINLTEVFGAGNEPDSTWCDAVFGVAGYWEGVKSFWNTYGVTALRTDVIEYFSASNLVTDGNMTDASNWLVIASTDAVANNALVNTGSGTGVSAISYQAISELDNENEEFYVGAKARVKNNLSTFIQMYFSGGASDLVQSIVSPIQNQWYDLGAIQQRGIGATGSTFRLYHTYGSTGDATGAVAEFQQARLLNLTANNMTDFTADQLDNLGYGEEYKIIKETRTLSTAETRTSIAYFADNDLVHEEVA